MEIQKKFWKDYINADYFDKKDMLKTLPLLKDLSKLKKLDDDMFEYILINLFKEYIDDAIEVTASNSS